MKKLLLLVALLGLTKSANAEPYLRLMDPSHPQVSAGFLISPKAPTSTAGVLDVALVTHSSADGSLCTKLDLGSWCVPESWVPVQLSIGGSFKTQFVAGLGSSANLSPFIASTLLAKVDASSTGVLAGLKTALQGSSQAQIRLGGSLIGEWVNNGTFQSAKEALPGRGPLNIIGNASRIDFSWAWAFQ